MNNYVLFEDPQTNLIFTKELDRITGKNYAMGIIEQLAEIKVQEKDQLVVENLLKGTDFLPEKIASLAGVSITFVEKVKMKLNSK